MAGDTSGKPRVVPWLGHKIAHAVAAACFAQGEDEGVGRRVQTEIEFRMQRERPLFIHIEQLQDLVEETLLELGYGKVALAYGKYRAKRSVEREWGAQAPTDFGKQLELATPEQLADLLCWKRKRKRVPSNSTASIKRGVPAAHRPRFSTPVRSIRNFRHVICSIVATALRK